MEGNLNFAKAFFLVALLASGFASAATVTASTAPALQVTDHSTVPSTLYPGTYGQLQVTVLNGGTATASGVSVQYNVQGTTSTIYPGDVGAGATSSFSLPFVVPQDFNGGVMVVYMTIFYQSTGNSQSSGSGTSNGVSYLSTQVSIPLEISQRQMLSVNTVSVTPSAITPGDSFTAKIDLVNSGGVVNNVIISSSNNAQFQLQGTTQISVGNILPNSTQEVTVPISSVSSTTSGKYTVPLTITYQDALQNTQNETAYIGPVTVYTSSSQFKVSLVPAGTVEVGSQVPFTLTLQNLGGSSSPAFVDINTSSIFTPIGSTRIYFDPIDPGQSVSQTVTLGVQATASAGYYELPLSITGNGNTYLQEVGIVVDATPELTITASTSSAAATSGATGASGASSGTGGTGETVTMSIANTGNTPIRSVYASAASSSGTRIVGASDKFIGTLNVDDFATFQVNVVPTGSAGGTGAATTIPVTITFKDSTNQQHSITKDVPVESASAVGASGAFAGRRSAGVLFGLGLIPSILLVIVVLLIIVYGYKRWKHEKIYFPSWIPYLGQKKKQ